MKKFETVDDLAKAVSQLAGFTLELSKGHSLHMAAAAHHEAHAAYHKTAHDAMDDGHEMKAHVGKMHEHHTAKAAHHKAMAETHKTLEAAATKLAAAFGDEPELQKKAPEAAATTTSGVVDGLMSSMAGDLHAMTQDMIKNDAGVKDMMRKAIAEALGTALGNQIRPDGVHATIPSNTPDDVLKHLQLVPRGSSGTGLEKASVDPGMEDALAI